MRKKRVTKIICAAVATISAVTLAFMPACGVKWSALSDKDTATAALTGTNGGFVVETEGYVYFINGRAANTDANKFGKVVKGSVQRIKRSDLDAENYSETQTVVPSVIYSGNYDAGLYIYGGYIYYSSPTTEKNTDGEVLNSNLDFKRTKLDGTDMTDTYFWQSSDNAVDYRYVEVDDTVYLIYALSENLYGTSATNIHSVNCNTRENTILAYNVTDYAFDTVDVGNPYIYYTMNVPQFLDGESSNYSYNQLYRVRADVTESPREYDFSEVEDYNPEENPVYINFGDFVLDGIGMLNNHSERITQLNYAYYHTGKDYSSLSNDDYTYEITGYKGGAVYFTRKGNANSLTNLYCLENSSVTAEWDAVAANAQISPLIAGSDSTEYQFVKMSVGGQEEKLYAINASSSGIIRSEVTADGKLENQLTVSSASSATVLKIREENGNVNLYYSVSGGNGYSVNRIAVDGDEDDYNKLSPETESDLTYRGVKILDLDANSSWFKPEFVGDKLLFASETTGMSNYNYIMVFDLGGENGAVKTNNQIDKLNQKYEDLTEKMEEYDDEDSDVYDGLANALKYAFYTGDGEYIDELIKAYVDIQDKENIYSEDAVEVFKDFLAREGDWADYKDDYKTINGEKVYANSRDYYYSVIGKISESDAEGIKDYYKTEYMKAYPEDTSTWWQKLSTGAKVGFIIGMVACGLLVIAGVTVLVIFLVKRKKNKGEGGEEKMHVDITDDKDVDVYGEEQ